MSFTERSGLYFIRDDSSYKHRRYPLIGDVQTSIRKAPRPTFETLRDASLGERLETFEDIIGRKKSIFPIEPRAFEKEFATPLGITPEAAHDLRLSAERNDVVDTMGVRDMNWAHGWP